MVRLSATSSGLTAIFVIVSLSIEKPTKAENVYPSPFRVVWNYPDQSCTSRNIDFELSNYGIVANEPRTFVGNEIATLYSSTVGLWPSFEGNNIRKPFNGGLPQLANLTAHLDQLRKDVAEKIPENSTGYAVFDQEVWRTLYELNYGPYRVYQYASMDEVVRKHGTNVNKAKLADEEWNKSAREFMETSLLEARAVRPNAHWGYYLYPRTWWTTQDINNRMWWLYQASTGIYPSIYIYNPELDPGQMKLQIEATLNEAIRVRDAYSQPDTPIIAYTIVQTNDVDFFNEDLLDYAIGLSAEMGIDGVNIWGSSRRFTPNPAEKCNGIKNYVQDVLGPYVSQLTNKFTQCGIRLCGGRGRCVRKEYARSTADILEKSSQTDQTELASVQEQTDPYLSYADYYLKLDASSRRNYHDYFSPLNGKPSFELDRTREDLTFAERSHGDKQQTRNTFSLRFDNAKNQDLSPTEKRSNITLPFNSDSSAEGSTITVKDAEPENNQRRQEFAPEGDHRYAIDPHDNYVCQCYSQWKGPFCEESNSF